MGSLYRYSKHNPMLISSFTKRCMQSKGAREFMDEKAPSTAEIMKSMEEDKERKLESIEHKEKRGLASQTADKAEDAAQDAVIGEARTPDSIKEAYKKESPGEDYRRTGETSHSTV